MYKVFIHFVFCYVQPFHFVYVYIIYYIVSGLYQSITTIYVLTCNITWIFCIYIYNYNICLCCSKTICHVHTVIGIYLRTC